MDDSAGNESVTRLARARVALLTAALPLLALAGLVVGVGAVLPWSDAGRLAPGWTALLVAVALLALALPVGYVIRRQVVPFPAAAAALAATAAAIGLAQNQLRQVKAPDGIAVAGPLCVSALVVLLLAWVLVVAADRMDRLGPRPRPGWRSVTAAVLATALLVVGVVAGVGWWRSGRLVDHTTAAAPRQAAALPATINGERWSVDLVAQDVVGFAGGDVVLLEDAGVVVLDSASGAQRWHYRYGERYATGAVLGADGSVLVVEYGEDALAGFDRATGRQLWWRDWPPDQSRAVTSAVDGEVLVLGDADVLTALSVRTGATVWRKSAAQAAHRGCGFAGAVVTDGVVLAGAGCAEFAAAPAERVDVAVGLDLATGRQLWRREFADRPRFSLAVAAPGKVLATSPTPGPDGQSVLVDAATGQSLVTLPRGTEGQVAVLGDTAQLAVDGGVHAYSLTNGSEVDPLRLPAPIVSTAAVGGQLLALTYAPGSDEAQVVRLGPDGQPAQQYALPLPACDNCTRVPGVLGVGAGVLVVSSSFYPEGATRSGDDPPERHLLISGLG
jgi:outer membrane protein assembly factor BamB